MRETKVDWSRSLAGTTSKAEPPFLVDQEDKRRQSGARDYNNRVGCPIIKNMNVAALQRDNVHKQFEP